MTLVASVCLISEPADCPYCPGEQRIEINIIIMHYCLIDSALYGIQTIWRDIQMWCYISDRGLRGRHTDMDEW